MINSLIIFTDNTFHGILNFKALEKCQMLFSLKKFPEHFNCRYLVADVNKSVSDYGPANFYRTIGNYGNKD